MFFRFGSALGLVILVCVAGVAIEKRCLELRRAVSRQHYRLDALSERFARMRLETQQLGAPIHLFEALESVSTPVARSEQSGGRIDRSDSKVSVKPSDREDR